MEVREISRVCYRVEVSVEEMEKAGITFESFGTDNPSAAGFIGYVLSQLKNLGFVLSEKRHLSVKVFQQEDSSLVIYFILEGILISPVIYSSAAVISDKPEDFFSTVPLFVRAAENKLVSAELYEIPGGYGLIFRLSSSQSWLRKRLTGSEKDSRFIFCRIKIEKIREYGNLISASPIELFI